MIMNIIMLNNVENEFHSKIILIIVKGSNKLFIYELLKEYKKQFGFNNVLLRNIKANKLIILYLSISIIFPVTISLLFIQRNFVWMIITAIIYLVSLFFGGIQHKAKMVKLIPENSIGIDLIPFRKMLKDTFAIETEEQLSRLDEIIKKEMAIREYSRKYPLMEVIRQLVVAILITGLLSYAFFEIRDGHNEEGSSFLALYFICIMVLIMISGLLKQIRDFGSVSYLHEISYKINLSLLDNSINKNKEEDKNSNNYIPRKNRHK